MLLATVKRGSCKASVNKLLRQEDACHVHPCIHLLKGLRATYVVTTPFRRFMRTSKVDFVHRYNKRCFFINIYTVIQTRPDGSSDEMR